MKGTGILNNAEKHSLIYPYLTYCVEVWGGAGDVYLMSLFEL